MHKLKHYLLIRIIPHTTSILFSHNHDKLSSKKATAKFWLALIPHVKTVCDKFKSTSNQYIMNTLSKHKINTQDFAYESKIKSRSTQMPHCTYSLTSKCGTNYLCQTGKP